MEAFFCGWPGWDVRQSDAMFSSPFQQRMTDIFRAVSPSE